MSHETYDEHLTRGGVTVDPARVDAFREHVRSCGTCRAFGHDYGYLDCPEGLRLAREACRPLDKH